MGGLGAGRLLIGFATEAEPDAMQRCIANSGIETRPAPGRYAGPQLGVAGVEPSRWSVPGATAPARSEPCRRSWRARSITGAIDGIGAEAARQLAAKAERVVLVSHRLAAELRSSDPASMS